MIFKEENQFDGCRPQIGGRLAWLGSVLECVLTD